MVFAISFAMCSVSVIVGVCVVFFLRFSAGVDVMERLLSHQPCRFDSDCRENSFCIGNTAVQQGTCRCKEGFVITRNRSHYECLQPATTVGFPCTHDLQCSFTLGTASLCESGICQCMSNAHLARNNRCYTTIGLGQICAIDFNCLLENNSTATCHAGLCTCPLFQHPVGAHRCVRSAKLGENCSSNDECTHTQANCYDVCRCVAGYAASENGWKCLMAATAFGQSCEELSQCTTILERSTCRDGLCTCHTGFHGHGIRCWRDVVVGGPCSDRRECIITPDLEDAVDCADGICVCLNGKVNVRGECVRDSSSSGLAPLVLTHAFFVVACLLIA